MTQAKKYFLLIIFLLTVIIVGAYLLISSDFMSKKTGKQSDVDSSVTLPPAIDVLRNQVAFQNLTAAENIKVISFREVLWNDSCLEIQSIDEVCTSIKVSGYEAVLEYSKERYTYRLNSDAGMIREVLK